ncbi:MAG: hypothetical protein BWY30_00886 [Tenericutes bacterium ADurb.Bin239]|nr:MAG: hypothetical protein BWY30_00886 [Tenericutes bacterium ADurb.Bin239]
MKKHYYTLRPQPFNRIKEGRKKIGMRLFDDKRQNLKVGDVICFTNTETNEELNVEVLALTRFKDFNELYAAFTPLDLGYLEAETISPQDMEKYYSARQIMKFGVLAIRIKVLNSENV